MWFVVQCCGEVIISEIRILFVPGMGHSCTWEHLPTPYIAFSSLVLPSSLLLFSHETQKSTPPKKTIESKGYETRVLNINPTAQYEVRVSMVRYSMQRLPSLSPYSRAFSVSTTVSLGKSCRNPQVRLARTTCKMVCFSLGGFLPYLPHMV